MIVKNVEKKEDNTLTFQVESDAAEFEAAVNAAYLKNKHSINIPGFRKGKAPRAVVEGMYGAEVFYQDAMDELAPKAFEQGVTENDVKFVGAPSIVDVNVTDDKTVAYTFSVTLYPEVTLGQYKGLSAERYPAEVDEDEIGYELEAARKRNSRKVDVEREAQMGDVANIDFDGYLNGERFDGGKAEAYDLELGSGSFVPGFEDQVIGMKAGEEKDIDITFPENYAPELAGKAVVFKIKLNNLSVNELPELDDEFAKDVSEFDTLADLKKDIKARLTKTRQEESDRAFEDAAVDAAAKNITVEIPACMIDEQVDRQMEQFGYQLQMQGMKMEDYAKMMGGNVDGLRQSLRPMAEQTVRTSLLLEAVAEAEKIEVLDEEVEEELKKMADQYQMELEKVKAAVSTDSVREELKTRKAAKFIAENAKAVEEKPAKKTTKKKATEAPAEEAPAAEAEAEKE